MPEPAAAADFPTMGLLEHLEELRRRVIRALISVAVALLVCFLYADKIYHWVQRPITDVLRNNGLDDKLVYLNPTEPFNVYLKVSLVAALFVASPFILYQVWMFISPGLYRNEKRYVLPFMFSSVGLFAAGGYFGYRVAYPATLSFLVGYGAAFRPMIAIGEYLDLFLTVIIGLGLVFELPILIFFLALMGVVDARFLWMNLRYAVLAMFVLAAIVTPTSDIMNMSLFAAPMIVLYVFGIGVAWVVNPRRRKAKAKAKAEAESRA